MSATIASRPARFSRLLGVGAYRPVRTVSNAEVCEHIDSTDEWIQERSGIVSRHFAAEQETVVDMATAAAERSLERAGVSIAAIDAIIVATVTHPYQTPSAAAMVADRLGTKTAGAIDVAAACAGFSYGVGIADGMVRAGTATYVLVIGVEKLTDFVDPTDRSTAFIFADGAGAVVIGPSDVPGIGPTVWGADGSQAEAIILAPDWVSYRRELATAPETPWPVLTMKGQAVFRWAVGEMAKVAREAVEVAGLTLDDIDAFIPHQANMRITDAMVRQLGLPEGVVIARDIATTGNTSGASIPLAMAALCESGEVTSGQTALLIGFGAGLAYAAQVVALP